MDYINLLSQPLPVREVNSRCLGRISRVGGVCLNPSRLGRSIQGGLTEENVWEELSQPLPVREVNSRIYQAMQGKKGIQSQPLPVREVNSSRMRGGSSTSNLQMSQPLPVREVNSRVLFTGLESLRTMSQPLPVREVNSRLPCTTALL